MNHSRWNLLPSAPPHFLASISGFSPLVAKILYNRGLTEPSQIELFMAGDKRLAGDPFLLPDIHQAITRILRALLSSEKIAIYGDFDADGITGTAVLVKGLSTLGGDVVYYIPNRITEGHGIRTAALEKLKEQGVSLIITVDCGTTDLPELEQAKQMGLDVVVTDHHTPLSTVPSAIAVVNPKMPNSQYPFTELAGVGVGYKVVQALFHNVGKNGQHEELLDLVAVGTIADMSPLLGENRHLVKEGLKLINTNPRLGIREMLNRANQSTGVISEDTVTWIITPRLNSAGRMDDAAVGYRLLMTDSPQTAQELAASLDQTNAERQRLTASTMSKAREQVLKDGITPLLMPCDKDYPIGIAGLVASRLSEEFYRPSVVVELGEETSSGSCRSIPEFNVILALNQCRDLLTRFGGHSQAAGFTTLTKNLAPLRQQLLQIADTQLKGVDLRPYINIDAEIKLPMLGGDTYQSIRKLAPFGQGNPLPTFLSHRVEVIDCRIMGNGGEHLRLKLRQGGTMWDAVAFRQADCMADVSSHVDIVYNLEIDNWNGVEKLRLNLQDFAPSGKQQLTSNNGGVHQ